MELILIDYFLTSQLTVKASDQALPQEQTTTVQVIITVPRDNSPPEFSTNTYSAETMESAAIGTSLIEVRATDNNLVVSRVELGKRWEV